MNNAGHGRMLVRHLDDTRVTPGWVYRLLLADVSAWRPFQNRFSQIIRLTVTLHARTLKASSL